MGFIPFDDESARIAELIESFPAPSDPAHESARLDIEMAFLARAQDHAAKYVHRRARRWQEGAADSEAIADTAADTAVRRVLAKVEAGALTKPRSWTAYLHKAVENAVKDERDRIRRARRGTSHESIESHELRLVAPDMAPRVDTDQAVRDVLERLKDLDPPPGFTAAEQQAFELRFEDVLNGKAERPRAWREIADELYMSESNARHLGKQALEKFRRTVGPGFA